MVPFLQPSGLLVCIFSSQLDSLVNVLDFGIFDQKKRVFLIFTFELNHEGMLIFVIVHINLFLLIVVVSIKGLDGFIIESESFSLTPGKFHFEDDLLEEIGV